MSRGWDGWMASPIQRTWVWASSGSWWWTGKPRMLQSMGLQRVRHDWATELTWTELIPFPVWWSRVGSNQPIVSSLTFFGRNRVEFVWNVLACFGAAWLTSLSLTWPKDQNRNGNKDSRLETKETVVNTVNTAGNCWSTDPRGKQCGLGNTNRKSEIPK